jgi:hypothetical protein
LSFILLPHATLRIYSINSLIMGGGCKVRGPEAMKMVWYYPL